MERNKALGKPMTKEEYGATLPERLSKAGQWMVDHFNGNSDYYIVDMKAVLK